MTTRTGSTIYILQIYRRMVVENKEEKTIRVIIIVIICSSRSVSQTFTTHAAEAVSKYSRDRNYERTGRTLYSVPYGCEKNMIHAPVCYREEIYGNGGTGREITIPFKVIKWHVKERHVPSSSVQTTSLAVLHGIVKKTIINLSIIIIIIQPAPLPRPCISSATQSYYCLVFHKLSLSQPHKAL